MEIIQKIQLITFLGLWLCIRRIAGRAIRTGIRLSPHPQVGKIIPILERQSLSIQRNEFIRICE